MNNPYIEIEGRKIGIDYPPLVIAEIGINHNGSLKIALDMVDAAYRAGAEIIKHQTHIIEDEMSYLAKSLIPGNSEKSIYDIMKSCALSYDDEKELKSYVESKKMIFLSTPFSRAAADRLYDMNVSALKIGSGECNNYPLLEHISTFHKPIIMSTGMNNIKSVKKAYSIFEHKGIPCSLLHTTNLYPTPTHLVRLGAMEELKQNFPDTVIGLSDHTTSNLACFAATALGASIIERHFTDTKERSGPDIVNSMDEYELQQLIFGSKEIWKMRGGKKEAAAEEKVTSDFAFATVVAIENIKKGEKLTDKNIWVKRPGTGEILAEYYQDVLDQTAVKDIKKDMHLRWKDFI